MTRRLSLPSIMVLSNLARRHIDKKAPAEIPKTLAIHRQNASELSPHFARIDQVKSFQGPLTLIVITSEMRSHLKAGYKGWIQFTLQSLLRAATKAKSSRAGIRTQDRPTLRLASRGYTRTVSKKFFRWKGHSRSIRSPWSTHPTSTCRMRLLCSRATLFPDSLSPILALDYKSLASRPTSLTSYF